MPSAPIARPAPDEPSAVSRQPSVISRQLSALGTRRSGVWRLPSAVWCLAALVLTGCAGGSALEARRGETRAATTGVLLPGQQATYTAREFGPKTPIPGPTATAAIVVEELALSTGVDGSGSPVGRYRSFPTNGGTFYVAALLHGLREGQTVEAKVATPDKLDDQGKVTYGQYVLANQVQVDRSSDRAWVGVPLTLDGGLAPAPTTPSWSSTAASSTPSPSS